MGWMKRTMMAVMALVCTAATAFAGDNSNRIQVGTGLLYKHGLDLTVAYEHETRYHNAWEWFGNAYLQWAECPSCGHVCPQSFWHNYTTWGLGVAYKPCVLRGKNHHGNLRLGGSLGSDRHDVLGGVHMGYEHSYSVGSRIDLFWQVKSDVMIGSGDLFRTGAVVGVKYLL